MLGNAMDSSLGVPAIPVVLDHVISATRQQLGNLRPTIAELLLCFTQDSLLLVRQWALFYRRVKSVQPALAALLSHAARNVGRDRRPVTRPQLLDELAHRGVLLLGPVARALLVGSW